MMFIYSKNPPLVEKKYTGTKPETIDGSLLGKIAFQTYTKEQLAERNLYKVIQLPVPEYNRFQNIVSKELEWDPEQSVFVQGYEVQDKPLEVIEEMEKSDRTRYCHDIDMMAANVRLKFASYPLIEQEYLAVYEHAKKYKEEGYPKQNTPKGIKSWEEAAKITDQEAADNIIETGDNYFEMLLIIRDIRLKGKAAVNEATRENIETVAYSCISLLESLIEK